jgi:hypothetical protein
VLIRLPRRSPAAAGRRRVATNLSKTLFALSEIQPKMRDYAVQVEANATVRNRLDGEFRTLDKGKARKRIDPKEGDSYSS